MEVLNFKVEEYMMQPGSPTFNKVKFLAGVGDHLALKMSIAGHRNVVTMQLVHVLTNPIQLGLLS